MEKWITNDHEETFQGSQKYCLLIAMMTLCLYVCVKIHQLCILTYEVYYMSVLSLSFSHQVVSSSSDTMDYSLPGFSVHGILHARILEWVAISFPNSVKIKKQPQQKTKNRYRRQRGCREQVTELFGHSKLPITGKIYF